MTSLMMRDAVREEVTFVGESLPVKFDDNTVITISKDGSCLSRFCDDVWDYSSTSTSIKTLDFRALVERLVFSNSSDINDAITFLKTITLHWVGVVGGCSMSKLYGDVRAVAFLTCYCHDHAIPLSRVFSLPDALDDMIDRGSTEKQLGLMLGKIQRFVDAATASGGNEFWKNISPSIEFRHKLKRLRKQFPETTDSLQTLLIPSKIYQGVLKRIIEDLELFVKYEDDINYVFSARSFSRDKAVIKDRKTEPSRLTQNQAARVTVEWNKLVRNDNMLSQILKEFASVGISKSEDWAGLVDGLGRWQLRCAYLISAFTGMRKGELLAIPLNGLKALNTENGEIPVVWSTTTKLEDGGAPHFTKWVTASIVDSAFRVARIITYGALAWSDDRKVFNLDESQTPLFISIEHGKKGNQHPRFKYAVTSFNLSGAVQEMFPDELSITTTDLAEIDWFMYGESLPRVIRLGALWPLTFHQFRRSLAVYAAASGKVSYPVLKAQLKHISMVMTVYYSDSSSRAVNILGDESEVKALRAEWSDAKARFEADELFQLLESKIPLAGSSGRQLRAKQAEGELPTFFEDRKTTKKAVKTGKIRYRPTLVGGCMSIGPCNKGAGVLASACVSCENAVFLPGSKAALEETKAFYKMEAERGVPKRAQKEYEANIKQIDIFLKNLTESVGVS